MRITYIILSILILFAQCKPQADENKNPKSNTLVCTTGMVADMVSNIVGEHITVKSLMGPGVDPHLYKATQGDLTALKNADAIIYNGLHLEGKMTSIFENLSAIKQTIPVASMVDSSSIIIYDEEGAIADPHIWFDVSIWSSILPKLAQELCELYPELCQDFTSNADQYKTELDSLHLFVKSEIARIPEEKRILITAHDAFEYFGRAYNIQVRGLQGISTLSEFGLKDRVDLVNYIVENNIPAVYVESSVPKKNIEAIVEGCLKKGHQVQIGGSLYSDAMGDPASTEGTYIGMVKSNVKNIVAGLNTQTQ